MSIYLQVNMKLSQVSSDDSVKGRIPVQPACPPISSCDTYIICVQLIIKNSSKPAGRRPGKILRLRKMLQGKRHLDDLSPSQNMLARDKSVKGTCAISSMVELTMSRLPDQRVAGESPL